MATSSSAKLQRRTIGFTLPLLTAAIVLLAIAWAALGQEIVTMPETRIELDEIKAELDRLRPKREELHSEIADLNNQIEGLQAEAEQARTLAEQLPILQAEELRARGERDRLSKESLALADEIDVRQRTFNGLTDRERSLKNEIEILENRTQEERKRLEEAQNEVNTKQVVLAKIIDDIAAKRNALDRLNIELSQLEQMRATKSNILKELVAEEQTLKHRIGNLQTNANELAAIISSAEILLDKTKVELDDKQAELEILLKKRDSTKFELDRVKALLDTTSTNLEAAEARIENLTRQEAKIRHQLRTIVDQLQDAVLIGKATGTTE